MQVPDDVPRSPGVFALLHATSGAAYVNETTNLRQRALLWQKKLAIYAAGGAMPARDFPKHPEDEWAWWMLPTDAIDAYEQGRAQLQTAGWKVFNAFKPRKEYTLTYGGQTLTASLAKHCKWTGAKLHTVYKRLDRGQSVEQALGIGGFPPLDKRELAIEQMPTRIVNENGGLLTYDEALMVRPELGDIRGKLKRYRRKHPGVTQVPLSEIPV